MAGRVRPHGMTWTGSRGVILSGRRVREHMESEKEPAAFVELGERCSRLTSGQNSNERIVMRLGSLRSGQMQNHVRPVTAWLHAVSKLT